MKDNERKPGSWLRDEMLGRESVQVALARINLMSNKAKCLVVFIMMAVLQISGQIERLCSSLLHNSFEALCIYGVNV
jgi:hypothetical protein